MVVGGAAAFQRPLVGSDGLESGSGYARNCFLSTTDLAIARTIRLGASRSIQRRIDMFNAFNQAASDGRSPDQRRRDLNQIRTRC